MIRILHIIDTTGPGGAETVFLDLIRGLDPTRYAPVVVIRGPGWVHDQLVASGITPHVIPAKGSFNIRFLRALLRLIRKERIDVIQSHLLGSNVYACLAGLLTRTPVVATFHGMVDIGDGERFVGLKQAILNRGAKRIVFVSRFLQDYLGSKMYLRPDRSQVIYNGIDLGRFTAVVPAPLRAELNIAADRPLIISVGNVRPSKGHEVLLKAALEVRKQIPGVVFVVVGDVSKDLGRSILRQRNDLGLEDTVRFLGFRQDIPRLLAAADLFVLPSVQEGFSIATIEAMATGVPVIVTRSGGPEEIIDNPSVGRTVAPGSENEIAIAAIELLTDRDRRRDMIERARDSARERFSIEAMTRAYDEIYRCHTS